MTYIIFYVIVITFAVIGFVECIRGLVFRFYKSKNDNTVLLITPAEGHSEDIEYTLRSCAAKVRWMGRVRPCKVICLDKGMDESTKQVCQYICSEYEFMDTMDCTELMNSLCSAES